MHEREDAKHLLLDKNFQRMFVGLVKQMVTLSGENETEMFEKIRDRAQAYIHIKKAISAMQPGETVFFSCMIEGEWVSLQFEWDCGAQRIRFYKVEQFQECYNKARGVAEI